MVGTSTKQHLFLILLRVFRKQKNLNVTTKNSSILKKGQILRVGNTELGLPGL